ncbi:MAG: extracellular solute-binding protein [Candidatus Coatesbacteria bacterium]|nr:extracellular solute-binding protein [Candidatus Coatesbacteria bacterium]
MLLAVLLVWAVTTAAKNETKVETELQPTELSGDLVIFHAGSLAVPLMEVSEAFMKEHPGVKIIREAAGSRSCARKISDLNRPCDVMASADYTVIDTLLIPNHASWNIKFASNEMAIVYHDGSRLAEKINKGNWLDILNNEVVRFGRSDPNADPCGYRAVLTMKLAEKYYKRPGLAEKMLEKDAKYVRPKETDLLALLESNTIDYVFLYRSVAEQHGLRFLLLPDEVNLKQASLADLYNSVSVEISGKKPGETITQRGEPMVYGVTIPKNSSNPKAALAFVEFLLNEKKGMAIMEKNGQPSVVPSLTSTYSMLPESLRKFATSH